jgi:PAS domain S-box-containing protein
VLYLLIGIGYFAIYAGGGWLLRNHDFARALFGTVGLLLPPLAVVAIILRRRRRWFGCQRLFWDTFAIGVALWIIGHVGWAFDDMVLGRRSWLQWHTVFSLCGGIGPLIALFARPHRGVRGAAVGTVSLVLASYGLLSFFIYSYFALIPSLVLSPREADVALLTVVQINRGVLFAAMLGAAWVGRRTTWRETFAWLALATGIGFVLRIITSLAIVQGNYQTGTLYDLAWIVPFLLYARAAIAAPDSQVERIASVVAWTPGRHAAIAAVAILLIPLIGYSVPYYQPLGGMADSFRALLTGLMTVAGLGLLTLRLAAQQGELQRADARIRLLAGAIEQTGDLILIVRANGVFEDANDAFLRATGYSRDELARQSFGDLMEQGIDAGTGNFAQDICDRGIWRGTRRRARRDGSTLPVSCTIVALTGESEGSTYYVGVERDITDELKLRDQLVHSERLSAVGELVAGVAHEINNPLQTIVGSVELLLLDNATASARPDLELVRQEAARAGHIVRNLLSFVRRGAPDRSVVDLDDIVRATVELIEYHLHQGNITVALDLQGSAPVIANREEIQQVVVNLLLNAEQAILSESLPGTITIRTRLLDGRQTLDVSDTGPGIKAEHQGRIFEPFFTTRDVGDGTGLGLSISHGIASAHGGSLDLVPAPAGACFRLSLPAHAAVAPQVSADDGSEGVALVVDDEAPIRKLVTRLLKNRGLDVIEADTVDAALQVAERHPLSLVVCDVRMPGIGGIGLYRRLLERDPGLGRRFVFITGDSSVIDLEADEFRNVRLLEKPFTAEDLRVVLSRVDPEVPA